MPALFHVSPTDHQIGTILQPGNFGKLVRIARVRQTAVAVDKMSIIAWESALEVARRSLVPNAPSRLDCLFAAPTQNEAEQFRQRFKQGAHIFEIGVDDNTPTYVADFESITSLPTGKTFVDSYIEAAMAYWIQANVGSLREVLIGGPITIVRKLP